MNYNFAYKLGHNLKLSINEFVFVTKDKEFIIKDDILYSNHDVDINYLGSIQYKAKLSTKLENLPKKLGYVTSAPANKHTQIIKILKSNGAKKLLISLKEPNIGQVKYVKNWIIKKEDFYLEILQYFDQEKWAKLDMNLPAKDMKKGIINLKLARSLQNLIDPKIKNIVDPFAGLGRNAVACWDKNLNFELSDLDPDCIEYISKNIEYTNHKSPSNSNLVKNYTIDAKSIKPSFNEPYSICTEGFLTTAANYVISFNEAQTRIEGVKAIWNEILINWLKLTNLKEAVICLPFFITRSKDIYWDIKKDLPKGWKISSFYDSDYLFYKRKDTRIGHMIVKIIK